MWEGKEKKFIEELQAKFAEHPPTVDPVTGAPPAVAAPACVHAAHPCLQACRAHRQDGAEAASRGFFPHQKGWQGLLGCCASAADLSLRTMVPQVVTVNETTKRKTSKTVKYMDGGRFSRPIAHACIAQSNDRYKKVTFGL